jgi:predicted dehydrogenase
VEKPLCLTRDELEQIRVAAAARPTACLMVGFNRRFAPQVVRIRQLLQAMPGPRSFVMTVNAGAVAAEHWTQDAEVGGGRLVGEACHGIDLLRHLADAPVESVNVVTMRGRRPDTALLQLRFGDGSVAAIHYLANGSKAFPKERLEVFAGGAVLQLDNFRRLRGFGWPGFSSMSLWRQDKGQRACVQAFMQAVRGGGPAPIPFDELAEVAELGIRVQESAR